MRPQIVLTFLKSMLSSDKVFRLCQDYGSKLFTLKVIESLTSQYSKSLLIRQHDLE